MSKKQKLGVFILMFLILATVAAGLVWHMQHYFMVDLRFYPKDATVLDLREERISIRQYNRICRQLPGCEIFWSVPFQEDYLPNDSREITITSLKERDLAVLEYFPELEAVQAEGCTDYQQLLALEEAYPHLTVTYTVSIGGQSVARDARLLRLSDVAAEEIPLLDCLPELTAIQVCSGGNSEHFTKLQAYCHKNGLDFQVIFGDTPYSDSESALTVSRITDADLALTSLMPQLRSLYLTDPQASADTLIRFTEENSHIQVAWEKTILGRLYTSDTVTVDLTDIFAAVEPGSRSQWEDQTTTSYDKAKAMPIQGNRDETYSLVKINSKYPLPDKTAVTAALIAQLEAEMAYFPNAQELIMLGCLFDNEAMAAFRDAHAEEYKVVWLVQCGDLAVRTDTLYFMPLKCDVNYFFNEDCLNLKYCNDIICMDIGHMAISDVTFLEYLPNLEYLVLAHTQVQNLSGIQNCKKLKFLELDHAPIKDYTPLLGCTVLEDLNIGETFAAIDPILEMTWLKHLWMVGRSSGTCYTASQTLVDTMVFSAGNATVSGIWRELPNYYAMRDLLHMEYMNG